MANSPHRIRTLLLLLILFSSFTSIAQKQQSPRQFVNQAFTQITKTNYVKAIEYANEALKLDSNFIDAYYARGTAYYQLKENENALNDFIILESKNYPIPDVYDALGHIYSLKSMYSEAIKEWTMLILLKPKDPLYYFSRANDLINLENYSDARKDLEKCLELDMETSEVYTKLGYVCSRVGEYQEAIIKLNRALVLDPANTIAYEHRGYAYLGLHELSLAESDYKTFLKSSPEDWSSWFSLGIIYYNSKKYETAINAFNKVLEFQPDVFDVHYRLGLIYGELNQNEKAIQEITKAIEYDKQNPLYFFNRGIAEGKLKMKNNYCEDFKIAAGLGYEEARGYVEKLCK